MDAIEEMESTANELLSKAQVKQKVCTTVSRDIVQWVSWSHCAALHVTYANCGLDGWQQPLPMNFPQSVLWLAECWARTF